MKRLLVWDLPVRLFHVLFAVTFVGAFAISHLADDESALFSAHMLLGLVMLFVVVLRVVWGFVGTRHARFASFAHGPRAVLGYVRGVFGGKRTEHAGHNPGSSVAIFLMLALAIGLGVTGIMLGRGDESVEDLHELLATALLIVAVVHVVGVIVHTVRLRDNITRSMVDGTKAVPPEQSIPGARPLVGLAFLLLTALLSWRLVAGFDQTTRTLTLPALGTLQLGEVEGDGARGGEHGPRQGHDDDD